MWEYQLKNQRPIQVTENADIHPVHRTINTGAEQPVSEHPAEQNSQTTNSAMPAHTELRKLHCPACHTIMEREFVGRIEIDRCPNCRGVFLDSGELEEFSKRDVSSYIPSQAIENTNASHKYLIYTPHGLSNHVSGHEKESG